MTLNVSCSPPMPISPDTVKTYLEIGQKIAISGGFAILTIHCMDIQRLPDVELPSLIVLFGATCVFFLLLLSGISLFGILPQLAIRNVFHLRRDSIQGRNKASIVALLPSIWVSCAGWLVLASLRFRHPQWMTLVLTVIWIGLPVFLTTFTKRYWVRVVAEQSTITNQEVNAPAAWGEVFLAFFTWAVCSLVYVLLLSVLMRIASAPNSVWLLVAALVLLANLGVDVRAYTPETSKISIGTIVLPVVLFLFSNNLPRLVFSTLGVGYIFCESGSVLVNQPAADIIWRVLPDAIDRDEPMPALIQKYDVEIVSKIGKKALLQFSLGPNERWNQKVLVPTESIADYRQVP